MKRKFKNINSTLKHRDVSEIRQTESFKVTNKFGNVVKTIFPNTLQVGLQNDLFNSTISGSIHHTRQGLSYLVAGENVTIVSGSNGQITISAAAASGVATPDVAFTRSVVPVDTDDTGGALDDGNDLSDDDISDQAFTKLDVNVGATNVTFAGHNESGNPSNNTYKVVSDSITAFTDNGTELTEANSASEGDGSYNITFANSGRIRLALALTTDSSDAKFRVSTLSEHEDGSGTDFNSIVINVPIKVTTAAGTQTITRSFTVQKIKKGTTGTSGSNGSDGDDGADGADGADGVVPLAIFGIDSSSAEIPVSRTDPSSAQFTTPYDVTLVSNSNVVSSISSGELTLAATGTYSVTVSIRLTEEGDGTNAYELTLALDDGAGSYTTLTYSDEEQPGGDEKNANLLIQNAIVVASAGGTKKLKSQIKKSSANNTYAHVDQSNQRLATIRVEKLA